MRLALVVEAINGAMDCTLKSVHLDDKPAPAFAHRR
jgi:hypothetical protein